MTCQGQVKDNIWTIQTNKGLYASILESIEAVKRRHSMGIWVNSVKEFCQNIHHVILICRWHLPSSCNRDFFARIFPACPIVLGTTMQSLKSWCFHGASSDVFRGVPHYLLKDIMLSFCVELVFHIMLFICFLSRGQATLLEALSVRWFICP